MHLCVVIAPNGLGHFRRALRLLHAVLERSQQQPRVTVVAEAWQRDATLDWSVARELWRRGVALVDGVMAPGVTWSASASTYDDGRLLAWEVRLARLPAFREATHVWSDNLAGVLAHRPEAFLTGSFLWSDVLQVHSTPAVSAFVERERALIGRCSPPIVAVDALAMPSVRARALLVPWMCEWQGPPAHGEAVAVLGGRTGTSHDRLAAAARAIEGRWRVVTDDSLMHDAGGYRGLAAAIVRPGAGSITDCVASSVPMLLLDEPGNPELKHNAAAVAQRGLGRVLPRGEEARAAEWIAEMTDTAARRAYAEAFAAQRRDGLVVAAEWILQHLKLERAR